jgi:hypothetical protein
MSLTPTVCPAPQPAVASPRLQASPCAAPSTCARCRDRSAGVSAIVSVVVQARAAGGRSIMLSGTDMQSANSPAKRSRTWRGRAARGAAVLSGGIVGVLFAFRALGIWEGGAHPRVPTAGLVYLGSIFLVGGLIQLHPRVWRWSRECNVQAIGRTFGRSPAQNAAPAWREVVSGLQERLVSREERLRDAPRYRHRAGMIGVAAGATIIVFALVR